MESSESQPAKAKLIKNVDLWKQIDEEMEKRHEGDVIVTWVKAHALPRHVRMELISEESVWGNSAADGLAGLAAKMAKEGRQVQWIKPSEELRWVQCRRSGTSAHGTDRSTCIRYQPSKNRHAGAPEANNDIKSTQDPEQGGTNTQGWDWEEEAGWDALN